MNGTVIRASPSGYINAELFFEFAEQFVHYLRLMHNTRCIPKPQILLLDGHKAHVFNLRFIELMVENNIEVVTFPPHTSHVLQPLDGPPFVVAKAAWEESLCEYFFRSVGRGLPKSEFNMVFQRAWDSLSVGTIQAGFRLTGIFPVNPDIICDTDLAPSRSTERGKEMLRESLGKVEENSSSIMFI